LQKVDIIIIVTMKIDLFKKIQSMDCPNISYGLTKSMVCFNQNYKVEIDQ